MGPIRPEDEDARRPLTPTEREILASDTIEKARQIGGHRAAIQIAAMLASSERITGTEKMSEADIRAAFAADAKMVIDKEEAWANAVRENASKPRMRFPPKVPVLVDDHPARVHTSSRRGVVVEWVEDTRPEAETPRFRIGDVVDIHHALVDPETKEFTRREDVEPGAFQYSISGSRFTTLKPTEGTRVADV